MNQEGPAGASQNTAPLIAGPDSYDPTLYEARAELDAEGRWTFTIDVSGHAGTGSASFAYEVKKLSPIAGLITLGALLAFLTILGLSIRAYIKDRSGGRRVRRRQA